jgi:hypothetical protein
MRLVSDRIDKNVDLPDFLNVYREVTDEEPYSTMIMADSDYEMPEKAKIETQMVKK